MNASLQSDEKLSLNWKYLSAISSGTSPIDLEFLALRNMHDARAFAYEYGLDIDSSENWRKISNAHQEAINFIMTKFLGGHSELMPSEVSTPVDPLQLLVLASQRGSQTDQLRRWSCAVLKVMHAIFYVDNNIKLRYFNQIREQVFSGLDRIIEIKESDVVLSDGHISLPVIHFDRKSNKERDSILLKLLQKAEYVAADIHDHLGIRLVFNTRFECLLALCLLQRVHLISAVNVDATRTRNTLLDLDAAKAIFIKYRSILTRHVGYPSEIIEEIEREMLQASQMPSLKDNPHSATSFNSLQVTVRKMISIKPEVSSKTGEAAADSMLHRRYDESDAFNSTSFFFEYEIQLMDRHSYELSQNGTASHEAYKQRQVETARLRVLGRHLVRWLDEGKGCASAI